MRADTVNKFLSFIFLAIIIAFAQGCAKKGGKSGSTSLFGGSGSGDQFRPGGEMGQLSPEEENIEARDAKYREVTSGALQDVFFDFDMSELREDSKSIIESNVRWIMANPGMKVQIEGHCDERGTEEYNLALGERRATTVKNYMVSMGVDNKRLFTISYGEEIALDSGHSEEAWAKNRRAHFVTTEANF